MPQCVNRTSMRAALSHRRDRLHQTRPGISFLISSISGEIATDTYTATTEAHHTGLVGFKYTRLADGDPIKLKNVLPVAGRPSKIEKGEKEVCS